MICDEEGLKKVCLKIQKNAFGDIRTMLAISKEIFERKLQKIRKEAHLQKQKLEGMNKNSVCGGDLLLDPQSIRVSIFEGLSVVDEKYADVQKDVLKTLSLAIQTCLLGVYFSMVENDSHITYVSRSSTNSF